MCAKVFLETWLIFLAACGYICYAGRKRVRIEVIVQKWPSCLSIPLSSSILLICFSWFWLPSLASRTHSIHFLPLLNFSCSFNFLHSPYLVFISFTLFICFLSSSIIPHSPLKLTLLRYLLFSIFSSFNPSLFSSLSFFSSTSLFQFSLIFFFPFPSL